MSIYFIIILFLLFILMVFLFLTAFCSVKYDDNSSMFPIFRIINNTYLFTDAIIKNNKLELVTTYYNNTPFDFNNIVVKLNNIQLKTFTDTGYNEYEPVRLITYDIIDISCNNETNNEFDLSVTYNNINKQYRISPINIVVKNKFTIATLFKNDYKHIENFYQYYKSQGVDRFCLYYNGVLKNMEDKFFKRPDIEYFEWNIKYWGESGNHTHHAQLLFLTHVRVRYIGTCDYLLLNDIDEYIYTPKYKLIEYLKENPSDSYMIRNKFATVKERTKDKVIIYSNKNFNNWRERSKCIYSKDFKGFMSIHEPKHYEKYKKVEDIFMYHIHEITKNSTSAPGDDGEDIIIQLPTDY